MKLQKNTLTTNTNDSNWVTNNGYIGTCIDKRYDEYYENYTKYETWRHINDIVELIYKDESIPIDERIIVKNVLEGYSKRNLR